MAGLPWTNPLKIQIGSDEHVLDTTINRGLMMLLNNDYYLDMKSMIMSTEINELIENTDTIKNVLEDHINNKDLHGKEPIIIQNVTQIISGEQGGGSYSFYNSDLLKNDLIVYLPINYSASKINEVIANVPHNLNTHNVVFLFVIPDEYAPIKNDFEHDEYILNIGNDNIIFSNFYNGTIFVVGDFLQKTKYFDKFSTKNSFKIEDPIRNDGINIKRYIANLFNEIDDAEDIEDIIKYETNEINQNNKSFNKIIIEGSSLNDNYSVLTFNDITANVYVKNLKFRNTLLPEYKGSNYISTLNLDYDILPSDEKFLLMYPMEEDLKPILGNSFTNYLNSELNIPIFNDLSSYIDLIISGCNIFSNKFGETSGLIYYLNNHNIYDFESSNIKSQYVINELVTKLTNINSLVDGIYSNQPSTNYDDFLNENGTFVVDEVKGLISNYLSYVNDYLKSIEEFFIEPNFIAFLKDRPDLINSTLIYDNIKLMDEYKKLYYNQGIELLLSGYNSIRDNVLYSLLGMRDFTSSLELHENGNVIPNISLNQRYNSGIKTNFIDGSLKCFELAKTNNSNIENGYFSIEGGYTELITKLIFTKHYWKNLNNRFDTSDGTELTKSEYDNTICFWRKHKGSSLDEVTYISFTFNNSAKCDFIIKGYSIENYNDNNKTSLNFNVNDLYTKYNDEWQLWCIKIDNEHVFDDTTSYSGKIGITCEVYVNEIVNGEYSIKKYVLNGESTSPFNVESPLFNKNDYWKNSKIYIGYSKFVESLNLNKNYFTGYIRNLMLFAGHLTESECRALFKAGIQSNYNFSSEYIDDSLLELFESKKFFIGLVGVYNVTNINILNCVMKYNGKYLK